MSQKHRIRLVLVDDHVIFRQSLSEILKTQPDLQLVGDAGSLSEAEALLADRKPDVLLLDLRLPGEYGLDLLRRMQAVSPETRTLVLTGSDEPPDVVEAMRLGARGFVQKHNPTALILKSIRKVYEGEIWLDSAMTETVLHAFQTDAPRSPAASAPQISPRERQIVQLVVEGCKNKEIARRLFISEKTVKNHLSSIFEKLGVSDRVELALQVVQKKVLERTPEHEPARERARSRSAS